MLKQVGVAFGVLLINSPAWSASDFYAGNAFIQFCRDQSSKDLVSGYAAGIVSGFTMNKPGAFCVPPGATTAQLGEIACQYLDRNPQLRQKAAGFLVVQALRAAWPCP